MNNIGFVVVGLYSARAIPKDTRPLYFSVSSFFCSSVRGSHRYIISRLFLLSRMY